MDIEPQNTLFARCTSSRLIVAVGIALVNIYSDIISSTYFDINYLKLKNKKIYLKVTDDDACINNF